MTQAEEQHRVRWARGTVAIGVLLALAATACGGRVGTPAVDGLGRHPSVLQKLSPQHGAASAFSRLRRRTPAVTLHLDANRTSATPSPPTPPTDPAVVQLPNTAPAAATIADPAAVARTSAMHRHRRFAPAADVRRIPRKTVLAALQGRTAGFATAHSAHPDRRVPRGWYGRSSVLPVLRKSGSRLKVRLPRRPNESKIWVNRRAVRLSRTHYALLVDLSVRRLYVFRNGVQKGSYAVGVGAPGTPTPTGTFFLAFHAPPTNSLYGPVMLETSAHSNVYRTFEGGNDAIIAIHGPIGAGRQIGNHGAAISNGCIRMHDSSLSKVARVPDGTPIIITH